MDDHVISTAEMSLLEKSSFTYAVAAVFLQIVSSVTHAAKRGNRMWALLNVLVWPTAYYYGWKVNLGPGNRGHSVT